MARTYHWLLSRDFDGDWTIEFGDYDKSVVRDERDDYRDHGFKLKDLRIHEGPPNDKYIQGFVAKLNALNAKMQEMADA